MSRIAVFSLAAVMTLTMFGSSWAYWSQEKQALNEYKTGKYSAKIVETFEPPKDWLPGQTVNKDVQIENDGNVPVFVKVKINQKWIRTKDIYDSDGNVIPPAKGGSIPLVFTGADKTERFAALLKFGSDVVLLKSGSTSVPGLSLGLPVVESAKDAGNKWLLLSETPDAAGDYTFYYIGVLNGGALTPLLVDEVRMNPYIQASEISERYTFEKIPDVNSPSEPSLFLGGSGSGHVWKLNRASTENPSFSYENARYTLGVTMYTVQATEAALVEMFRAEKTAEQGVISELQSRAVKGSVVDYSRDGTVKTKRLWFDESNGTMMFTPVTNGDEWFMGHLSMLPGEAYNDTLEIENKSRKTYRLYMQAIPVEQQKLPNELLGYIRMKVYHGSELLYNGTALGSSYEGSVRNLQNLVNLGQYKPGERKDIRVELTLDKNTPMEYCDIYSRIDWKFMVEGNDTTPGGGGYTHYDIPPTPENRVETPPDTPTPVLFVSPKTGDERRLTAYTCVMTVSGAILLMCVVWLAGDKRRSNNGGI